MKLADTKSLALLVVVAFAMLIGAICSLLSWLDYGEALKAEQGEYSKAMASLRAMAGLSLDPALPPLDGGAENLRILRLEAERLGLSLRLQLPEEGKQQQQGKISPTYPGVRSTKLQTVIVMGKEEDLFRGIYMLDRLIHAAPLGDVAIGRRGAELIMEATLYGK
jgi:hypothetical protein